MLPTYLQLCTLLFGLAILGGCQQGSDSSSSDGLLIKTEQPPSLKPPKAGTALQDFASLTDVKEKKSAFFDYLEPQIEQENKHIAELHAQFSALQLLLRKQGQLHPVDADWLNRTAKLYRVDETDPAKQLQTLKAKVGIIPAALVKAQAANESAWGTSRFAREANNLFGQWCFTPGCGIAPKQRNPGDTHEVQSFPSVAAGLRSYFVNLNGHQSYADMRQIRRCLQSSQKTYSGRALAAGLVNYSARGGHYVDELQSMIRINELEPWHTNWWGENNPEHPCYDLVQVEADHPDPVKANTEATAEATIEAKTSTKTKPEATLATLKQALATTSAALQSATTNPASLPKQ